MTDETNKKLKYFKRGDVRTMEKDMASLREKEAEKTRETISQLRTEEGIKKAAGLSAEALARAEEREKMAFEAKKKEEELIKLREEKAASAISEAAAGAKKEEGEKERLRAQFKEAQRKEEEERRKFLESVAAKSGQPAPEVPPLPQRPSPPPVPPHPMAEARPVPPPPPIPVRPAPSQPAPVRPAMPPVPPVPPPPVQLPVSPLPAAKALKKPSRFSLPKFRLPKMQLPKAPKVNGYFPAKPSIFGENWARIIVTVLTLAILAAIFTFWYWYFAIRPGTQQTLPPAPPAAQEPAQKEPEIVQNFLGTGYYLPANPRIIDTIVIYSGFNTSNGDPYDMDGIIQSYKKAGVATHYLISRDGSIYQLAPEYAIAYHAGSAKMPDGRTGVNNFSVGVSLVYQEAESPNDAQYQSLGWLIEKLKDKYTIPSENILGYKDISAGKTAPWNFDWEKFKLLFSFLPPSPDNGAEFILKSLTLEEKIGQLLIVGFDGLELTPKLKNFIEIVRPGGVILFKKNIESAQQVKKLIQDLQKISLAETDLPLLVAIDQEGGVVSRIDFIEEKTGQFEIKNASQAYQVGLERGKELKNLGINLNLAPVLDLAENGDFIYERSFQKNREETGNLAKFLSFGQKTAGILTAIKHFPGYGGIPFNPEERLATLKGVPQTAHFQKAVEAKPELIMLASVIYPSLDADLPITFSGKGIAFLKQELGENPLIATDDLSQKSFPDNFSLREIVSLPIEAGADILLFSGWDEKIKNASAMLVKAVRTGDISEKLIDRAVLRIIQLKQGVSL